MDGIAARTSAQSSSDAVKDVYLPAGASGPAARLPPATSFSGQGSGTFVGSGQRMSAVAHHVGPQALFGGAAAADFELPFLLSVDNEAADDTSASAIFTEVLQDLFTEAAGSTAVPLAGAPRSAFGPSATAPKATGASSWAAKQVSTPQNAAAQGAAPAARAPHAATAPATGAPQPASQHVPPQQDGHEGSGTSAVPPAAPPKRKASLGRSSSTSGGSEITSKITPGGPRPADAVQRRAAVQKRYREKKEANMRGLTEQAEQQAAALAALESEHAELVSRQAALQKLVNCRDEQLTVLAQLRGRCRADAPVPGPDALAGGDAGRSELYDPQQGCWGNDCASPTPLASRNELMQYKTMSMVDLRARWLAFVGDASKLLSHLAAAGPDSQTLGALLDALVHNVGATMRRCIQLNCPIVYMLMQLHLETCQPCPPPDAHWDKVLGILALSEAQAAEARTMFHLYCELMEKVLEERRMLKAGLAALAAGGEQGGETHHPESDLPAFMLPPGQCCMDEMATAEQLYLNVHKERSTRCLLCCFFFGKLVTPMQLARVAVAAHPWFPDPLCICRQLALGPAGQGATCTAP